MLKIFRKAIGGGSNSNNNHNNNVVASSPSIVNANQCNTLSNQNVNYNHNHVTNNRRDSKAVQQAAAVAAATAAVNAHSSLENNNLSGSSLEISNSIVPATHQNVGTPSGNSTANTSNFHRQHYHMNIIRSKSPSSGPQPQTPSAQPTSVVATPTITTKSTSSLTNVATQQLPGLLTSSVNNTSNSNLKMQQQQQFQQQLQQQQYQFQQQQNVAVATASAAAEYYEQQLKLTQHKHLELDQQFRANLEQLKELKETVNNLNEMNRKLYEENHQYKDRNIEQRQQIEHYHVLFQENQQKNEQSLSTLRKERDDAYQHENELKRRTQQTLDTKHNENFALVTNLNEKLDDLRSKEAHLSDELSKLKITLQQEKSKSELLDKKNKLLEKDVCLLKESWNLEKSDLVLKIKNLDELLVQAKTQNSSDTQKVEDECHKQLASFESKLEEVIKENTQISCKYTQVVESNRDLNLMVQNKQALHEQMLDDAKNKLECYMSKCADLEKECNNSREMHVRDTEEWKKFQADLQTAVRVANDFMTEAEEKMCKMKEESFRSNECQNRLCEEIERLKAKLTTKTSSTSSLSLQKSVHNNKENQENSNTSLVRNLIDTIESTTTTTVSTVVLASITNESNHPLKSSSSVKSLTNSSKYASTNFSHSTDADDAKMSSSTRVRSNSTNNDNLNNRVEYLILNPGKVLPTSTTSQSQMVDANGYNYSIYSTLPSSNSSNSSKRLQKEDLSTSPPSLNNNSDALTNLFKQYGVSKRNALMKWCQDRLSMYKGIEIKNFSSSWNDGLAFCALIHSFMPSKIDYEQLRCENNPRKNFQTAFKSAQSVGIQQTLNIHELLNHERPDWNAVMNYVTLIYKHFQQNTTTNTNTTTSTALVDTNTASVSALPKQNSTTTRSSSSSPIVLRNSIQNLPLSLSVSSNSSSSNNSNPSSAFTSASSSSSSISKAIC